MRETIGDLWGIRRTPAAIGGESEEIIFVDMFSQSLAATRTPNSVQRHTQAQELANNVTSIIAPHLSLLGDLHTHPYHDLEEVNEAKGWQFSDEDIDCIVHDDALWKATDNRPLAMVLAVCRLKRVHDSMFSWPRKNVLRFDVGEFRFWLSAGVGELDESGKRFFSGNGRVNCCLTPPGHFNGAGTRLE